MPQPIGQKRAALNQTLVNTPVPKVSAPRTTVQDGKRQADLQLGAPKASAPRLGTEGGENKRHNAAPHAAVAKAKTGAVAAVHFYIGEIGENEDEDPATYFDEELSLELDEGPGPLSDDNPRVIAGKQLELERFSDFDCYEVIPASERGDAVYLGARWEKSWKWNEATNEYDCRARYVGQEFKWLEWRDDLFAPAAGHDLSRLVDFMVMKRGLTGFTCDASNAYFHAPEDENVVVKPPKEFVEQERAAGRRVDILWRMKKILPGRRKGSKSWMEFLAKTLVECGLEQCPAAPQFYKGVRDGRRSIVLEAHMDDMHGGGVDCELEPFFAQLESMIMLKIEMHYASGAVYDHLKRHRRRTPEGTYISPNARYVQGVAQALGLDGCKSVATPSVIGRQAEENDAEKLEGSDVKLFRSSVGSLAYAAIDREDVQLEINRLAKQMSSPTVGGMVMLRRVVRYMVGTADFEVKMPIPTDKSHKRAHLKVFCDSDWAGQPGRNSQTSVHVEIDGCPMHGYSKRQEAIALSSAEAEYYALTSGLSLGLYVKIVLEFMDFAVVATIASDSSAARGIARREGVGRVKHLSTRCLWAQQVFKRKLFNLAVVLGTENPADLGTKEMAGPKLKQLCGMVGLGVWRGGK